MKLIISLIIIFSVYSCNNAEKKGTKNDSSQKELKGRISISGAFALYPITVRWAEEFKKIHPKVVIDISAGGAGKGMTDALTQMVDIGMFSRNIRKAEKDKGAWWVAVAKDAVLPTINVKNPLISQLKTKGISKKIFIDIFINNKIKYWEECFGDKEGKNKMNIYTRSDACGAAEMWAQYLGGHQEGLSGIGVFGDPGIADALRKDKNGIGYNNIIYIYDNYSREKYNGIDVIPIDLNENGIIDEEEKFYTNLDKIMEAIKAGKYPSPPARDLYLVSKGKPERSIVIVFLKWILTEGQKYLNEAGYTQLPEDKIQEEIKKLN
ncbi:MAG: PstS family phosphate ABC transporter substrate-binding protein [Bacteroidales bacterium]|nr:PstS family phosphate ABC transporter substrate-binding protein [Bacteroidales bacterium]